MKRLFLFLMTCVIAASVFTGCAEENMDNHAAPWETPFDSNVDYSVKFITHELPCQLFLRNPSSDGSRFLILKAGINDPKISNISLYNINTNEERNLTGSALDAKLFGNVMYWIGSSPEVEAGNKAHLFKTDLSNDHVDLVYSLPDGYTFLEALSSDDNYVVWGEYKTESGITETSPLVIKSLDCATGEINTIAKTGYLSGGYSDIPLNNGFITYVLPQNDEYHIMTCQLSTGEETEQMVTKIQPYSYAFDGEKLVWCGPDEAYWSLSVMDVKDHVAKKVETGAGDVVDCNVFHGRYVIFTQNFGIKVYDTKTQEVIFDSVKEDDFTDDTLLLEFFEFNSDAGIAVIQRTTYQEKSSKYLVSTLRFCEG